MEKYDIIVIGAGPAGYIAALKAAGFGKKTAVVEMDQLGGTCLNRGCVPTKSLLHSAEIFRQAKEGERFGVMCPDVQLDAGRMYARRDEVVSTLRAGIARLFQSSKIALYHGRAVVGAENTVLVEQDGETTQLCAENMILATGSSPAIPPIEGAGLPGVVTSDDLLTGEAPVYRSLVIIGGGVIGAEFAAFYTTLGCRVVIIEALERILPTMDRELSQGLAMNLKKRGAEIHTGSVVKRLSRSDEGLKCTFEEKGVECSASAEAVLIATGRRANTQGLFAQGLSVEMQRGMIVTDAHFMTSVPGIYAVGDITRGAALAHVASAQGTVAAEHIAGRCPSIDLETVPSCVYTSPEIASVGLTADEARAAGRAVKTGKALMSANGKSVISGAERGIIKLVFDAQSEELLGAQLMCERATDMIDVFSTAIVAKLKKEELLRVIHPHPTYSEAVADALAAVK